MLTPSPFPSLTLSLPLLPTVSSNICISFCRKQSRPSSSGSPTRTSPFTTSSRGFGFTTTSGGYPSCFLFLFFFGSLLYQSTSHCSLLFYLYMATIHEKTFQPLSHLLCLPNVPHAATPPHLQPPPPKPAPDLLTSLRFPRSTHNARAALCRCPQ